MRYHPAMVLAIVCCTMAATVPLAAAGACSPKYKFGANVVANPGAEIGPCGLSTDTPVPCWKGKAAVVCYGASGGFPTPTSPGPANRGKALFAGGPNVPSAAISQTLALPAAWQRTAASGKLKYAFKAALGGWEGQNDFVSAELWFRSKTGKWLQTVVLPFVYAAQRKTVTGLFDRAASGRVPPGTASVVVNLVMTRKEGNYNDGYVDNVQLSFKSA